MNTLRRLGPGLIITASFVGPGTVTTSSIAGASFGFALMWAVVFSIFATIVLQEMAGRLGVVSREGLGEALRTTFRNPLFTALVVLLVVAAIAVGNATYAQGDITGTSLGLESLTGVPARAWAVAVGVVVFALLASGSIGSSSAR